MALTKIQGGVVKDTAELSITSVNATGVITASSFVGDGSRLTGISGGDGIGTPMDETSGGSQIFKTSKTITIGAGTSVTVHAGPDEGNVAFTRADNIVVASGATFRITSGTTLRPNILGLF